MPANRGPQLIEPEDLVHLREDDTAKVLLLDLRVLAQYSNSSITGALNLCIPTTLQKRQSYNVQRLADTFASRKDDLKEFLLWRQATSIVVYDAASWTLAQAASCVNILAKFTNEKWEGAALVLRGGFKAFSQAYPDHITSQSDSDRDHVDSNARKLSIHPPESGMIAGGCAMPATKNAANPFFGTIRQNMDLIGGVGQIPLKLPGWLKGAQSLPHWLRLVAAPENHGKIVADRFLDIERAEQKRMQKALAVEGNPASPGKVRVAGIEKGMKNRYKDILPFDHSRVKLQDASDNDCDYINASHVHFSKSDRHYIACQAPTPVTFPDFWRTVWEQEIGLVVMLTAENEGGQVKCHPYWEPGRYGPFEVKVWSEERRQLVAKHRVKEAATARDGHKKAIRPPFSRNASGLSSTIPEPSSTPSATIRTLTVSYSGQPFAQMRQVYQIQYSDWPDFGTPADPQDLLALNQLRNQCSPLQTAPILVHCSAGCGRTGTFCTVDTVLGMLEAKTVEGPQQGDNDWIAECVAEFRQQRLSMVQTLRQFVLCYETCLEWFAGVESRGNVDV